MEQEETVLPKQEMSLKQQQQQSLLAFKVEVTQ